MSKCNRKRRSKVKRKQHICVRFDGGRMTSDGGFVLLGELDRLRGVSEAVCRCLFDRRDKRYVKHILSDLIRQRIFQIIHGYEDCNDADSLRSDPALKTAVGRRPESDADLASQPTLSRLDNSVDGFELKNLHRLLVKQYLKKHGEAPREVILDFDATDDPTHGQQQLCLFHGFYGQYMYLPLLVYDGEHGDLLAAVLRPGSVHASRGVVGVLRRIVGQIRERWPNVKIVVRADAGFAIPRLYDFCEAEGLGYAIGLIQNPRLQRLNLPHLRQAAVAFGECGEKVRLLSEALYQADSWPYTRRVIMKAEAMPQGTNQRFVVTNLPGEASELYHFYIGRGQTENYIKEFKNALKADRLSCHRFLANQFRLLLHAFAYTLVHDLRRLLAGTEFERVQLDTLRLKILKVGGRVRETARKIWFHMSESYAHKRHWELIASRLGVPSLVGA